MSVTAARQQQQQQPQPQPQHVLVVKNLAGDDILGPCEFSQPPSGETIRRLIARASGDTLGSRLQLLHGASVVRTGDLVSGGDTVNPNTLTLIRIPAGCSDRGRPVRVCDSEEEGSMLGVPIVDHATRHEVPLPIRYFLGRDGKVHLGVLAAELAPLIGALLSEVAAVATVEAVFEEEDADDIHGTEAYQEQPQRWEVVGGGRHGGILVRTGEKLHSTVLPERLATGAIVEQQELVNARLRFVCLAGRGPNTGWVSVMHGGRELLRRATSKSLPAVTATQEKSSRCEAFRSVVAVQELHRALCLAAPSARRANPAVDVVQRVAVQLDLATLNPPSSKAMQDALAAARNRMTGLWLSG